MLAFSFQMFLTSLLLTATGFAVAALLHENVANVPKWVLGALVGGVLTSLTWVVIFALTAIWTVF